MYINTYNPHIETMEGAAVHYVALQETFPCIHIRAVSNAVGDRDRKNGIFQELFQFA
jgi:futalosine hydrolase